LDKARDRRGEAKSKDAVHEKERYLGEL
jgi:hypothetical protein